MRVGGHLWKKKDDAEGREYLAGGRRSFGWVVNQIAKASTARRRPNDVEITGWVLILIPLHYTNVNIRLC